MYNLLVPLLCLKQFTWKHEYDYRVFINDTKIQDLMNSVLGHYYDGISGLMLIDVKGAQKCPKCQHSGKEQYIPAKGTI